MSRDIFEMIKKMDRNNFEIQFALQCSPFITGLKISNLFAISILQYSKLEYILTVSNYSFKRLYYTKNKVIYLLYDEKKLKEYLRKDIVRKILYKLGYPYNTHKDIDKLLVIFKEKYARYMEKKEAFPHEMGIFLGYPIEDVVGYLKNNGENSACVGYWKVYKNVEEKQNLFREFEYAKESVIRCLAQGMNILDVMKYYSCKNEILSFNRWNIFNQC